MAEPEVHDTWEQKFPRPDFELLGVPNEWLLAIRKWAAGKPRIEAIYLFGSRAKLTHRPDSDIDLALLLTVNPSDTETGYWICNAETFSAPAQSSPIGLTVILISRSFLR